MNNLIPTRLQSLQKKSTDALGIFQNTVNNLSSTNASIRIELKKRSDKIQKLKDETSKLNSMEAQNQTVMTKIEGFLGSLNTQV
jgi:hypothetical protein